jgi:hypothetical protein
MQLLNGKQHQPRACGGIGMPPRRKRIDGVSSEKDADKGFCRHARTVGQAGAGFTMRSWYVSIISGCLGVQPILVREAALGGRTVFIPSYNIASLNNDLQAPHASTR